MNNYHIHEIIGRGRQSKVYKARLKQSLEYVVVKACAKDLKPRVLQEVKVLNSMSHPNLLRFHTWYETQNHLWVILEYCVGGDLLALLRSDGRLPEASVLRLGRDLAAAVQHLHSKGILHCDLKPSNILLDGNGRLRLGGLGISRRFEVVQRQLATLPNGLREMQQGSPFYLAPETVHTPGLYTTASDLWAVGCILYECACGRPPFAASTTQQLNALILEAQPQLPPGCSPELEGLIARLLDKDPTTRCTWPELCSHPFWGASPPALMALPDEPVMDDLHLVAERSAQLAEHGEGEGGDGAAARHRASGSGSSLGSDAEFGAAGAAPGTIERSHSGGSSGGGVNLEALVYHPTDSVMKPIVGNKRIERPLESLFNPSLLPFQPLPVHKVVALPSQSRTAFVAALARTISGAAHPHTKLATLIYCESLCSDVGLVQEMVNGDMGPALVGLLDLDGKDGGLRLRAANMLGLLIRHASSISPSLAESGVCDALAAAIRQHEDPSLQRRAAAALGELLFYADSQHREVAAPAWDLAADAVQRLTALLQPGQDDISQHYAAKALENVFGLGGPWAHQLSTAETMGHLLHMVDSELPDVVRGTAASALCRLLRCEPSCLPPLLELGGVELLAAGLTDGSPRVQQACVTILCQLLTQRALAGPTTELCLGNELLLEGLASLLDNPAELLQVKALVALALLCRSPTGLVCVVSWQGLLGQMERLCCRERLQGGSGGSSDQYLAAAVSGLMVQLASNVVPLLRQAAAAARAGGARRAAQPAGTGGASSGSSSGGGLQPLEALLALLSSAAFRSLVVCDGLITGLADLLTREVGAPAGVAATDAHADLKVQLLNAIDAVCSHPELLIEHYAPVLSHLLPALSAAVASQRETPDTRFCCLKLLCDVVLQFVNEPRLYLSPIASEHTAADSGIANRQIDAAVGQYVLPLMPALFEDEDPMPLYALKLLGALLEFNRRWVADVAAAGLAGRFFEWLSISHPHNNVHNMRLCRLVADARVLPPEALVQLQAVDRVLAVLAYAHDNDVEPFLEPALHLCTSLMADVGPSESQKVIAALHLLLELAGSLDPDTALAAAHCLLKAAHLHPADAAAVMAAPESMALVVGLLDQAAAVSSGAASGGERGQQPQHGQPPPEPGEGGEQPPPLTFHPDCAPLLLLVLAAVVEARPELLHHYGASLRPAVAACLAAVGDPGLKRRWAGLLARTSP
ncbi:kinase [Chlorella sorokiniana]|uniref:Kinase n=1 Tax=Chlorella sorokiniana TaxID=3076 RepID=A0A2P6TZX3_CHLSO|nr:kinase [Chlorella sorokiniana]|eukprot:PRW59606.1 kinase [Chlorella sorokiniana]